MVQNLEWRVLDVVLILEIVTFQFSVVTSDDFTIIPQVFNSHLVLGQGTSFVWANTWSWTQSLDGLQVLDQDFLVGKLFGSNGQRNCDTGQKSFRDVCDQNTNSENDAFKPWVTNDEFWQEKESYTQNDGNDGNDQHESIKFFSEWRFLLTTGGSEIGNLTHDGFSTNVDNNTLSSAFLAQGTEKG